MPMEDLSRYNPEGSTLRKAQLRMLDILVAIDKVCRENNIKYWIDFGTLLGAVRHKGFIPWDDDIDICVLDEDYGKLRKALIDNLPDNFVFQDYTTDRNAFFRYGHVRDRNSYCYYPYFVKLKEQGLWVDIFRVDKVNSLKVAKFIDFFYRRTHREIHNYGKVAYKSMFHRLFVKLIAYILHPFVAGMMHFSKWFACVYKKNRKMTRYAMNATSWFKEENIFPLIEIEFEGHMFYAPRNYDAHLRINFGDYMQVPPEDMRIPILDLEKVKIW